MLIHTCTCSFRKTQLEFKPSLYFDPLQLMIAVNFYKTGFTVIKLKLIFTLFFNCQYCLKLYMNCFANFIYYYYYLYILSKRHSGYPTWKSWMRQVKDHFQANKNLGDIIDCHINWKIKNQEVGILQLKHFPLHVS